MKKKILAFILAALMVLGLAACGSSDSGSADNGQGDAVTDTNNQENNDSESDTRTVTDMAGTKFEVPADLSHIITVNSVATQAVLMLGGVDAATTVGRGCFDGTLLTQMFPEIKEYEENGRYISSDLTIEAVMELNNTIGESVVLTGDEDMISALRDAGCYAAYFSVNGPEDLMDSVRVIGEILGGEAQEKARQYTDYYQNNIDMVKEATASLTEEEKPTVLFVRGVSDTALTVFNAEGTFPNFWIDAAGGINAADVRGELTWDEVAAIDPDVIITEKVSGAQDLLASEAFSQLSAVKNGKVYTGPFGVAVWTMGSTEEALTVVWAAKTLHPDILPDADMEEMTKEYYETFFGYTPTQEQIQSILAGNG